MSKVVERASGPVRRDQIKKATLDILYNQGLKKFSTKNLAQQVHLSQGAIFRHFQSKNDIILEIMEDVKNDLLKQLQRIARENTRPDRRLEEFMCYHVNYLKQNKGITILLFAEAAHQNNYLLKKQLNEFFSLIKQYFGKIIHDGIAEKMWDCSVSVDSLATLYIGVLITINIEVYLNRTVFTYKNFCEQMLTLFKRALAKYDYDGII